jgi:hypothetical protein
MKTQSSITQNSTISAEKEVVIRKPIKRENYKHLSSVFLLTKSRQPFKRKELRR